jgi:PAS domain S-box-containing protein
MATGIWPHGGGEVGATLRGWSGSESELGAPADWPEPLASAAQLVLNSPAAMALLWGETGILIYNDAYSVIAGAKHPGILGMRVHDAWPELVEFHSEIMAQLQRGQSMSYRDLPLVLHRNGEAEEAWLNVDYGPIYDRSGAIRGILATVTETTAIVTETRAREAAEQALRKREQELAQVQKIGRIGGLEVDLRTGYRNTRSPEYLRVHGLPPEAANESHEDWVQRLHPAERADVEEHFKATVAGNAREYHAEYRIIRPSDGQVRWIGAVAHIERDERDKPIRLIGAHIDITERKEAEAQQRLLMQELSHRVKNSLAMVQAIASNTLRNATSLESAREAFSQRLAALARAHDLLVGGNWANAALSELVESIVGIQGQPERFLREGPEVMLGSKAALALTLILHELATNAVKYGSLSNAGGRVRLTWRLDEIDGEPQFRLRWQEEGGPEVAPPTRRGFGSRLIERTFPTVKGNAELAYPPTGVVFTLDAPLSALKDAEG